METSTRTADPRTTRRGLVPGMFRRGSMWYLKWYEDGKRRRVALGTRREDVAGRRAARLRGRLAAGETLGPRPDKVRWEEATADLRRHYEATGKRDLAEYDRRVKPLNLFFRGRRLAAIGQSDVDAYTVARQKGGVTGSTVRRELSTLTKALRVAYKANKLARLPALERPAEGEARTGFVEPADFAAIRARLPVDLQVLATLLYTFAWRKQEALHLERRHVDLTTGEIRLDAAMTKTKRGRVVFCTPEVHRLLSEQLGRVDALQRKLGRVVPWLFPNLRGAARRVPGVRMTVQGDRMQSFRRAWAAACKAAGRPGLLVHDLRRSGVRNLVRVGVSDAVAMALSGHKTRSVFLRYDITSEADLREAARRLAGPNLGPSDQFAVESRLATPR